MYSSGSVVVSSKNSKAVSFQSWSPPVSTFQMVRSYKYSILSACLFLSGMLYVAQVQLEHYQTNNPNNNNNDATATNNNQKIRRTVAEHVSVAQTYLPLQVSKVPNDLFEGHILGDQTRHISRLSWFLNIDHHLERMTTLFANVADSNAPYDPTDVPFYWELGGVNNLAVDLCQCFPIRVATSYGDNAVGNPNVLEPHLVPGDGNVCHAYNVNLGTHSGVGKLHDLGFGNNVIPDFVSSPFLPEIASLFTETNKGRIFSAIPNTAARIMWTYMYLSRNNLVEGSMLEFVSSDHILANNYLTRILSGKWNSEQELEESDLQVAQEVLETKFVLTDWAYNRKLISHFIRYEHWDESGYDCMYPPENPYSQESMAHPVAPPERTPEQVAEQMAVEAAIELRNYWDDRLYLEKIGPQVTVQMAGLE